MMVEITKVILVVFSSLLKYSGSPPSDQPKNPNAIERKISTKKVVMAPKNPRRTEPATRNILRDSSVML